MPQQQGLEAQGRIKLNNAVRELIGYISSQKAYGSDEFKAAVDALKVLAKVTPDVSEALSQSEMAVLMGGAQGVRPAQPPTMLGTPRPMPNVMAGGGGLMR